MTGPAIARDIVVMLLAAKAAGVAFERLGQPAVIGELLAGVVLGAHTLGVLGDSSVHTFLQQVGAVVLLFAVGLGTPISELKALGGRALTVSVAGMVLPFLAGAAFVAGVGGEGRESIFVGAALVSTSVGVTARVLSDLGQVRRPESRVILGAAIVDDVLGLLVLAVVTESASDHFSPGELAQVGGLAIVFVGLAAGLGPRLVARLQSGLDRLGHWGVFFVALTVCTGLAALAESLRLAAIIGAFLAGLAFAETTDRYDLERKLRPWYWTLVPFFFVVTGARVDPSAFDNLNTTALGTGLLAIAVAGKFAGCGLAARPMGSRAAAIVGVGMVPRGEVGVLVAAVGLSHGILDRDYYGIIVAITVATTMVVPPVLRSLFKGAVAAEESQRDIDWIGG